MRLHKDNGSQDADGNFTGTTTTSSTNSHIFGTDVMIVTMNDSGMDFNLVPPPPGKSHHSTQKEYYSQLKTARTTKIQLENYSM